MDSGGGEQNYWPGFVDALANVVLTLIFVLIIFVFALTMASNKVEQKMKEVVEAQAAHKEKVANMPQTVEALQAELQKTRAELDALRAKIPDMGDKTQQETTALEDKKEIKVQDEKTELAKGSLAIKQDQQGMLTIGFPDGVSIMDANSETELGTAVQKLKGTESKQIIIKAFMGNEEYSAARRIAYYRALNVRNFLITTLKVNPTIIVSQIVKAGTSGESHVELVFRK